MTVYCLPVTLVLLLAVSGAIIVRSYMMRRRHQRQVAEAIRNGTYVPPNRPKKKFGERPTLFDVYLGNDDGGDGGAGAKLEKEKEAQTLRILSQDLRWENILVGCCYSIRREFTPNVSAQSRYRRYFSVTNH